jgi:lipopolysaccharide/colanic/teichoic acid biosynthesis glycosyltransferase
LFPLLAIIIKLSSKGPVLFKQERWGLNNKRIICYKFRSMYKESSDTDEEGNFQQAQKNDPRITLIGKILRKTNMDELPQFWNVLKGEMSLVGTRPPTPDEVEKYGVPEWQRLNVKPGMTGQWQVFGRSEVRSFEDVIQLDLDYQKKWSLKYDIELILRTIFVIFNKNSGAV